MDSDMITYLRQLAAEQGEDLDALLAAAGEGESVLGANWNAKDPTAVRVAQAERTLAFEMAGTFADARADHPAVADWVRRYIAGEFANRLPWLTLIGDTGAGKTRQLFGVLREVVLAEAHDNRSCRWWFVSHPDLSFELQTARPSAQADVLNPYVKADFLGLDDLGAGVMGEYGQRGLQLGGTKLFDERYRRRLPMVISTNLGPAEQVEQFGARLASRLLEGTVVALLDDDHRVNLGEWHQ